LQRELWKSLGAELLSKTPQTTTPSSNLLRSVGEDACAKLLHLTLPFLRQTCPEGKMERIMSERE
jgi:hypothetical protein